MNIKGILFKDRSLHYKFALVTVVPILIVIVFIVLFATRELEKTLIDETLNQARELTGLSVLSMSNAFVIYNKELLDNFIDSLSKEKSIRYAMVVDSNDNRILSHTNHQNDGQVLDEPLNLNLQESQIEVLQNQEGVYEISAPLFIKGVRYGFIRLGFSPEGVYKEIAMIKNRITAMAMIAITAGAFFPILLVRIISKPIRAMAEQSLRIGAGDFEQEITYQSQDALGKLAQTFNKMTKNLKTSIDLLKENETKYQTIFEYSPISLWEEDLSAVKTYIDNLQDKGIKDLIKYFDNHPEEREACINQIKVLDVNQATLKLYEAESKQLFFKRIGEIRTEKTYESLMVEGVIPLIEGKTVDIECIYKTLSGKEITVLIRIAIPPAYHKTWEKAFVSVQDMTERKRSALLEQMFDRYISREVMDMIIESPDKVKFGGEKRKVTIMITDLRGFTALSERIQPEQVVQMLNNYFEAMVDVALQYQGTINEITGDSLLVMFGAPQRMPDRAQRAIACAIAMQNAMAEVRKQNIAGNLPHLEMGIGLNDAEVIVGNLGSKKRSKYGVVGSGVNMTSRIESFTVGGQILISESVKKAAEDIIRIDNQMEIHPKGADMPFTVYEVGGISGEYNLTIEDRKPRYVTLHREIPIRYTVLDGTYIGQGYFEGTIVKISPKSGELRLQTFLEPLVNIKINLADVGEDLSHKDFYAKVLEGSRNETDVYKVSFTAVPPGVDGYFQAILTQGNLEEETEEG